MPNLGDMLTLPRHSFLFAPTFLHVEEEIVDDDLLSQVNTRGPPPPNARCPKETGDTPNRERHAAPGDAMAARGRDPRDR